MNISEDFVIKTASTYTNALFFLIHLFSVSLVERQYVELMIQT